MGKLDLRSEPVNALTNQDLMTALQTEFGHVNISATGYERGEVISDSRGQGSHQRVTVFSSKRVGNQRRKAVYFYTRLALQRFHGVHESLEPNHEQEKKRGCAGDFARQR